MTANAVGRELGKGAIHICGYADRPPSPSTQFNQAQYSPVARGGNEVQTAVDPVIRHESSVDPGFRVQEVLAFTVDVVNDRLPTKENTREEEEKEGWVVNAGSYSSVGLLADIIIIALCMCREVQTSLKVEQRNTCAHANGHTNIYEFIPIYFYGQYRIS